MNVNSNNKKMLVYVFYPYTKPKNPREFFSKELFHPSCDECSIFLKLEAAQQYARFMGRRHIILETYIDELHIEGKSQMLSIKTSVLSPEHTPGYYLAHSDQEIFYPNPAMIRERGKVVEPA